MRFSDRAAPILAILLLIAAGCSDDDPATPAPKPGKITASAAGIAGQDGSTYSVVAYASDWYPGATFPVIGAFRIVIAGEDFSSTSVLLNSDTNGNPTSGEKTFEPGQYSVVFFVSPPGSPPQAFAEVRMTLDGDVTATAPPWAEWVHP